MCKRFCALALCILSAIFITYFLLIPTELDDTTKSPVIVLTPTPEQERTQLNTRLREFLEDKQSPLAPDTEFILELKHWKLLIAVSAIESQYCNQQLGYNCWGIGGDSAYRYYSSFQAAAVDANDLIESWQKKGKWLTVENMNGSYVVPASPNWVAVVNKVMKELDGLQPRTK